MGFMDEIGGILGQFSNAQNVSDQDAHAHYDQIHNSVPTDILGSVIGPALSSLGGGSLQQTIGNSVSQMNPDQRTQLLQVLLNGLQSSGTNLPALLQQLGVSPSVLSNPQQASTSDVTTIAAHAHANAPGVFNRAMEFYSNHPTLVKAMGTAAILAISRQLTKK